MGILSFLIKRSSRTLNKHKTPVKPPVKKPIVKKGSSSKNGSRTMIRPLPIVRRELSASGGDFWSNIIGSSLPGAKKMQFPFENIPPVSVNVSLEPSTRNALLGLGGLIGGSLIASSLIKTKKK